MSTADITQLRRELEQIADDAGKPNYRGDAEHFTSLWANVGRHVPILLDEIEQLRTADVQRRADGWLDPDQADELRKLTATCSCGTSPMTYEGPQPDCPVHGAVRALNHAMAERVAWQPVVEAARALRWLLELDGSPFVIDHRYFAATRILAAAVDALDRGVPDE